MPGRFSGLSLSVVLRSGVHSMGRVSCHCRLRFGRRVRTISISSSRASRHCVIRGYVNVYFGVDELYWLDSDCLGTNNFASFQFLYLNLIFPVHIWRESQ